MSQKCAVSFCPNNRYNVKKRGVDIIFHGFPKQGDLLVSWVKFCKNDEGWMPRSDAVICSAHFTPKDYQMQKAVVIGGRTILRRLNPNAIPSLQERPLISKTSQHLGKGKCNQLSKQFEDDVYHEWSSSNLVKLEIEFVDFDATMNKVALDKKIEELESKLKSVMRELKDMKKLPGANIVLQTRLAEVVEETQKLKIQNKALKQELKKIQDDPNSFEDFSS